jgi:hypothetical protein
MKDDPNIGESAVERGTWIIASILFIVLALVVLVR